ncbi:hypothetical protein FW778_17675 [Ginsengibacter hankyongi]|uniref:Uncharacterized protein n=1 Tax=Ginsengibacter hankyongi TaxID=2607284 RepID=A0A5J5IF82_9BACT|nr:hypothetical protein [Ginsengibacter hankyongi]KAA9037257.1 hypothetical protein FW778_17675 [Ginsengibacter hankyongi]
MKQNSKLMLLLIGVSLIIFTGCQKDNSLVSPSAPSAVNNATALTPGANSVNSEAPADVFLTTTTLTSSGAAPQVVKTGSFVASAQLGTSGTYVMTIDFYGMAIHCTTVFTPAGGDQFTTYSECQMTTFTGQWRIIDGKGAYANLQANGSIIMKTGHEYCTGRIFSE